MTDQDYMKLALRLARRGLGKTSPNPMVGAVIVKDGRIIGTGYHHYCGGDHAEIDALKNATGPVTGATMYVTLEPCSHSGKKTPPCVDALIQSHIGRVVAAALDPNPQVDGRGLEKLRRSGISTGHGILEDEARRLNQAHFKLMGTGMPLITIKYAQTLDGRIAVAGGSSQWISSPDFRRLAHRLRATHDAVMVGVGTVVADDPELTVRLVKGRNPLRVVLDSTLRMPLGSKLIRTARDVPTLIATTSLAGLERIAAMRSAGAEVTVCPANRHGEVDASALLKTLGSRGVSSVLVEGGAGVITGLLRERLADRLVVAIAPKIMGRGIEAVGDLGIKRVGECITLSYRKTYRLGGDLVIEADFVRLNIP